MSLASGARLGPYEIAAPLGAGGMGEVWKARDTRLNRFVALKILPSDKVADADRKRRFVNEAQAASRLNHPNIVTIYDIAEANGVHFIAMEYVRGRTLEQLATGRGLPLEDSIKYAAEIADAVAAAHAAGIIHRDLKPGNIMITEGGRAKVLDFGLAKLAEPAEIREETVTIHTAAGVVVGTAAYMSPEQAQGKEVDARSDIFSFGLVLYELLSGQRAFRGDTWIATLTAILHQEPRALREIRPAIPSGVEQTVARCLRKNPAHRFQSMVEVKAALEDSGSKPEKNDATPSIAVLPFANLSGDKENEYLSDGITESIINSLAQIVRLRVTPRSTVFRYKGKDVDPQAAGNELGVRVVLTGRVIQRVDVLVVSTELIDVAKGTQLWGERYNRKVSDIIALEEEIARKISESLRMTLTGGEKQRLSKRFTGDSQAYQLYLRGRHYWAKNTPSAMEKAVGYFRQAIDKDPDYALAYSGLADCYCVLTIHGVIPAGEGWANAKATAAAAVDLDPDLAEGETSMAVLRYLVDWDWAGAEKGLQRAIGLNPAYWIAPYWYAILLTSTGRLQEAERQVARVLELEPLSPIVAHMAAWASIAARRYDEAIDRCSKGLEIDPDYPLLRLWLGVAYEQVSQYEDAIRELKTALQGLGFSALAMGALGHAHALTGNPAEAKRLGHELLRPIEQGVGDPYALAVVYAGLGERDQAFEWLNKAVETRTSWLTILVKADPRLDKLRADSRFEKALSRMGLQP